jgi:uncharacterized membrane protein (DUF4010 family)
MYEGFVRCWCDEAAGLTVVFIAALIGRCSGGEYAMPVPRFSSAVTLFHVALAIFAREKNGDRRMDACALSLLLV